MGDSMPDRRDQRVNQPGLGRVIDYLFGRNTLIAIASLMLLVISGYATWSGMQDFIVGVSTSAGSPAGREVPGGFTVSHDWLVVAITVALTFLMWLALRETFGAQRRWHERLITFPLYLFLALWSIGFGYGFWWSLISGVEATRSGLQSLQEDARDASAAIAARLDAVKGQLDSVVSWSEGQMAREETSGGSCGVPSGAGKGPLTDDEILQLLQKMVKQRQDSIALYEQGGRKDLADQERGEIAIISEFLPKGMQGAFGAARVMENGGRLAMLHPRETVIDHSKGQQSAGRNVIVTINQLFAPGTSRATTLQAAADASRQLQLAARNL